MVDPFEWTETESGLRAPSSTIRDGNERERELRSYTPLLDSAPGGAPAPPAFASLVNRLVFPKNPNRLYGSSSPALTS